MNRLFLRRLTVDAAALPPDSYLAALPAVRCGSLSFQKPVTFFVGENGTGKSTLIEAIAIAWGLNPEGGSRNFRFSTRDSHSDLHRILRLEKGPLLPRVLPPVLHHPSGAAGRYGTVSGAGGCVCEG